MPPNRIGPRKPGESGREHFRALRREALKRNWRDLAILAAIFLAGLGALVFLDGALQLIGAFILGVASMMAVIVWIIGGDVFSLPPVWGAVGEEQTGDVLDKLDDSWWVEHDIPYGYGNYDHVVIGAAGVFLLDTKRLSRPAKVTNDELRAGGMRYDGNAFRRAAVTMADALALNVGSRPWVQSVVVVWGTLEHETREENRVVYVQGENLVGWLQTQPARLTAERCRALARALAKLREDADAQRIASSA